MLLLRGASNNCNSNNNSFLKRVIRILLNVALAQDTTIKFSSRISCRMAMIEMIDWSSENRTHVGWWLDVGKTVLGFDTADPSKHMVSDYVPMNPNAA